jgi:hypothetical protein
VTIQNVRDERQDAGPDYFGAAVLDNIDVMAYWWARRRNPLSALHSSNVKLNGLTRIRIAVIGLLAVAILTIFNFMLDASGMKFPDIALFDKGIALVRPSLPTSGTVGWYTDSPGGASALQEYYLAQYALSPVVVVNNTNQKLVIASIHSGPAKITDPNLQLVRDFGNGIQLLRNKTK